MINFINKWKEDQILRTFVIIFLILLACLTLIYSPALTIGFAPNDDYYYFTYDTRSSFSQHPQYIFFNLVGRELYNVIGLPMAFLIRGMDDFASIRIITLILLAASCALLATYLVHIGATRITALISGLLIAILPGFQAGILWVTMAPFFVGLLLAIIAGLLVQKINLNYGLASKFNIAKILLSSLFLICSLFIYQPWAMMFFLPFVGFLLFEKNKTVRLSLNLAKINFVIFSLACISYYLLHKFILLRLMFYRKPELVEAFNSLGQFRFEISNNPASKIFSLFLNEPDRVFGLWDVYQSGWGSLIAIAVIMIGAIVSIAKILIDKRSLADNKLLIVVSVIYVASFLSVLAPYAMSEGGHSGFRVLLPASVLLSLLVAKNFNLIAGFFASQIITKDKTKVSNLSRLPGYGALFIFILAIAFTAHKNIKNSSENNLKEFNFVQSLIFNHIGNFGLPRHIHIVMPQGNISFDDLPSLGNGEFNYNSTSNWPNIPWIVRAALMPIFADQTALIINPVKLDDLDINNFPSNKITVTSSSEQPTFETSPNTLVINMNNLMRESLLKKTKPAFTITSLSDAGGHVSSRAFDGSVAPDDFWESLIANPITLDVNYADPITLNSYEFSAGETTERMPVTWRLLVSEDSQNWTLLDSQTDFKNWSLNESRIFAIKKLQPYRHYRFVFEKSADPEVMRIYEIKLIEGSTVISKRTH